MSSSISRADIQWRALSVSRMSVGGQRRGEQWGSWASLSTRPIGIPPEALDLLDGAEEIPMLGTGSSLNVAVAGSLVLHQLAGLL